MYAAAHGEKRAGRTETDALAAPHYSTQPEDGRIGGGSMVEGFVALTPVSSPRGEETRAERYRGDQTARIPSAIDTTSGDGLTSVTMIRKVCWRPKEAWVARDVSVPANTRDRLSGDHIE